MHRERARVVLSIVAMLSIVGCTQPAELAHVEGEIVRDGQPCDQILVTFVPTPNQTNSQLKSSAVTDAAGRFRLRTEDGQAGAIVGRHRVVLEDLRDYYLPRNDSAPALQIPPPSRVLSGYRAAARTPLACEVRPGTNEVRFTLPL